MPRVVGKQIATPDRLAQALSSQDAAERNYAKKAMRGIAPLRDCYWKWFESETYFLSRLEALFFIGFQGTLSEDFELLENRLGLPGDVMLPTDDVEAHANPRDLDRTLQDASTANLQRWYEGDFRFLDLCKRIIREDPSIRTRAAPEE